MRYMFIFTLIAIIIASSCGSKTASTHDSDPNRKETLEDLRLRYSKDNSDSTFLKLVQSIGEKIRVSKTQEDKEVLIIEAIELCLERQNNSMLLPFQEELNKVNSQHEKNADFLYEMGTNYEELNDMEIAEIFYHALLLRFPGDIRIEKIKGKIKPNFSADKLIEKLAKATFTNPDTLGMNYESALRYITGCKTFAIAYPDNKSTPEYLFRAAEMSRGLNQFSPMMSFYNWIIDYFPTYNKMPIVLFTKGFLLETEFNRLDDALQTYQQFLDQYPDDPLADDVRIMLENIGNDPIELINKKK